ncbi:MAG: NUDIX domain-containing protein [Lentisphaeria bacterium]|nr:NUDIX domain-containing protein [Lentisphaeria bacterium]
MAELFDIYDESGNHLGTATRSKCHGDPALIHCTAHVAVMHPETGALLLQKRRMDKDIQPGKWDSAVGGHLDAGESFETAALRELAEELGVTEKVELRHLFDSRIRNSIESENVRVFGIELAGPFEFQKSEIDGVRFFSAAELDDPAQQKEFTPNLIAELAELKKCGFYPAE